MIVASPPPTLQTSNFVFIECVGNLLYLQLWSIILQFFFAPAMPMAMPWQCNECFGMIDNH